MLPWRSISSSKWQVSSVGQVGVSKKSTFHRIKVSLPGSKERTPNKETMMKTILTLLAVTGSFLFFAPQAEARPGQHLSRHTACGCPIQYRKVFYGYRSCGTPIYRYHPRPVRHRCHLRKSRHQHHYYNRDRGCRTHYGYRSHGRRGGYSFHLSYSR